MKYKVTLNGRTYEIEVEAGKAMCLAEYEAFAPAAAPAPAAPAAAPAAPAAAPAAPAAPAVTVTGGQTVSAPMPGTILKVNVSVGQAVKAGEVLVVLEAMKMENEIMAPADGVITQVAVSKGSSVETGAVLVTIGGTAAPAAPVAAPVAAPAPAPAAPAAPVAPAPAAAPVVTGAGETVNAPMPGTILNVNVSVGQTVQAGAVLVVLEAMKMENEIMAPKAGTVTQVLVSRGSSVDTGAPMVVIA